MNLLDQRGMHMLWLLLKDINKLLSDKVACAGIHTLFYNTTRSEKDLDHKKDTAYGGKNMCKPTTIIKNTIRRYHI